MRALFPDRRGPLTKVTDRPMYPQLPCDRQRPRPCPQHATTPRRIIGAATGRCQRLLSGRGKAVGLERPGSRRRRGGRGRGVRSEKAAEGHGGAGWVPHRLRWGTDVQLDRPMNARRTVALLCRAGPRAQGLGHPRSRRGGGSVGSGCDGPGRPGDDRDRLRQPHHRGGPGVRKPLGTQGLHLRAAPSLLVDLRS